MNGFKQAFIDQGINQRIEIGDNSRKQKDLDNLTKYFLQEDKSLTFEEAKNKAQAILNFE